MSVGLLIAPLHPLQFLQDLHEIRPHHKPLAVFLLICLYVFLLLFEAWKEPQKESRLQMSSGSNKEDALILKGIFPILLQLLYITASVDHGVKEFSTGSLQLLGSSMKIE